MALSKAASAVMKYLCFKQSVLQGCTFKKRTLTKKKKKIKNEITTDMKQSRVVGFPLGKFNRHNDFLIFRFSNNNHFIMY